MTPRIGRRRSGRDELCWGPIGAEGPREPRPSLPRAAPTILTRSSPDLAATLPAHLLASTSVSTMECHLHELRRVLVCRRMSQTDPVNCSAVGSPSWWAGGETWTPVVTGRSTWSTVESIWVRCAIVGEAYVVNPEGSGSPSRKNRARLHRSGSLRSKSVIIGKVACKDCC